MPTGQPWMIVSTTRHLAPWVAAALIFFGAPAAYEPTVSPARGQEVETPKEPTKVPAKEGRIRVTLDWKDVPLRERLVDFGKKYKVPIFLDRRVDPDQKIELSVREQ